MDPGLTCLDILTDTRPILHPIRRMHFSMSSERILIRRLDLRLGGNSYILSFEVNRGRMVMVMWICCKLAGLYRLIDVYSIGRDVPLLASFRDCPQIYEYILDIDSTFWRKGQQCSVNFIAITSLELQYSSKSVLGPFLYLTIPILGSRFNGSHDILKHLVTRLAPLRPFLVLVLLQTSYALRLGLS